MAKRGNRARSEIIEQYFRRRSALVASCNGFDSGLEWEAERIANEVFTFVYTSGSIVSVLSRLGLLEKTSFVSSGRVKPNLLLPCTPLAMGEANLGKQTVGYVPKFGNGRLAPIQIGFEIWWNNELIFKDENCELTRKRLVLALRNQDGGGHVGELTDGSYLQLKSHALSSIQIRGQPLQPAFGALGATMRQVGWELIETLNSCGDLT